jgi:hypothetical protein
MRAKAERLGARDAGILHQRDTFFIAQHARLKLREFGDGRAELICDRDCDCDCDCDRDRDRDGDRVGVRIRDSGAAFRVSRSALLTPWA